ncbi:hypothetical protein SRIMM317S_02460 [Streptomyces rimosus subsp. rimosus]
MKMQTPTIRMTASTKYAWPKLEPAKRDLRPGLPGLLSWRMTIRARMPSTVMVPMNSTKTLYGAHSPMTGSSQSALKSWPMALTIVSSSEKKPTATNQCAAPTMPHLFIRVWPRNSLTTVTVRCAGSSVRVPAGTGWPSRSCRTICRMARPNSATPTAIRTSDTMIAASCMGGSSGLRVRGLRGILLVGCAYVRGVHGVRGDRSTAITKQ